MSLFWLKRMKESPPGDTSWAMPYGDLMSLLLAVFVLIATMSELRAGPRFEQIGAAVRAAFGFDVGAETALLGGRPDLLARLTQAGSETTDGATAALLRQCEIDTGEDDLIIRVPGAMAFDASSARLKPDSRRVLAELASHLVGGRTQIEVRGYNGDGPTGAGSLFRDALELSYARARAAADQLVARGVPRERLLIVAAGDQNPLTYAPERMAEGVNRRLEIVVRAAASDAYDGTLAEKGTFDDGG